MKLSANRLFEVTLDCDCVPSQGSLDEKICAEFRNRSGDYGGKILPAQSVISLFTPFYAESERNAANNGSRIPGMFFCCAFIKHIFLRFRLCEFPRFLRRFYVHFFDFTINSGKNRKIVTIFPFFLQKVQRLNCNKFTFFH